jgi:hypothetical protein
VRFMIDGTEMGVPENDEDEIDIYAALGLNTPVEPETPSDTTPYDPLAAFMDDDDDVEESWEPTASSVPDVSGLETSPVSHTTIEILLATLARDLLESEMMPQPFDGGSADYTTVKVQRDRDAYHLSLIVDMGGHPIKPFATVLAVDDQWKPLKPPTGLSSRWHALYASLSKALATALAQQGRPSTI